MTSPGAPGFGSLGDGSGSTQGRPGALTDVSRVAVHESRARDEQRGTTPTTSRHRAGAARPAVRRVQRSPTAGGRRRVPSGRQRARPVAPRVGAAPRRRAVGQPAADRAAGAGPGCQLLVLRPALPRDPGRAGLGVPAACTGLPAGAQPSWPRCRRCTSAGRSGAPGPCSCAPTTALRVAATLYAAGTALVVIGTAEHYVLDAVAGALVVAVAVRATRPRVSRGSAPRQAARRQPSAAASSAARSGRRPVPSAR